MPEAERVRLEIAFRGGPTLGVSVSPETADQLDRVLAEGNAATLSFEDDDGRYTVVLRMVSYVKRHLRESRVGFGAVR